jgi:hypothetical protein
MIKRAHPRKQIRIACSLDFYSGDTNRGYTANLSFGGALVDCGDMATAGKPLAMVGDPAIFSMSVNYGGEVETLKLSSRVVHITNGAMGVQIFPTGLPKPHQALLMQLLE